MKKEKTNPSQEYINYICDLYGDIYDDRIEDCHPPVAGKELREPGADWIPGQEANHKSLNAFRRELQDAGIELSTSKIRKILITGKRWSTERSREIAELFDEFTASVKDGGKGLSAHEAMNQIAKELEVSLVTVSVNLPYQDVVYKLENRSRNAIRCSNYQERKKKGLTRDMSDHAKKRTEK